ncbi:hypothetical protein DUNSADRAFT_2019 [Dunaliella salina]|uniref:Encoded protein n=1 Tax=Dunaliella salina TaxID=3046 RepID=A0ABQ7FWQ9_DUNSA|nr:hypothetical protein DUNSADRAFT_2019 [Dunaliella salina]|eukprot:KAF5826800.1 hypothetical protein DUNSADRAFT_2019 [Dunaliella salina]
MLSTEQSCKLLAYNVVINTRLLCQLKLMPYITTSVSKYAACCLQGCMILVQILFGLLFLPVFACAASAEMTPLTVQQKKDPSTRMMHQDAARQAILLEAQSHGLCRQT